MNLPTNQYEINNQTNTLTPIHLREKKNLQECHIQKGSLLARERERKILSQFYHRLLSRSSSCLLQRMRERRKTRAKFCALSRMLECKDTNQPNLDRNRNGRLSKRERESEQKREFRLDS